jgi:hypothetical protein
MVDTLPRPNATLPEILAYHARRVTRTRLSLDIIGGLSIAALAFTMQPAGWITTGSAAVCWASYGAWGFADRALAAPDSETTRAGRAWRAGRAVAAVVGSGAAIVFVFSGLGLALGTFIS